MAVSSTQGSVRSQVAAYIAKYSPQVARQFRSARTFLRKQIPHGYELVYDNYNALGCGFSPTTQSSAIVVSIVAYPRWVTLFFFQGVRLADPEHILQGSGSKIRSLRLEPFSLLRSEVVGELLALALLPYKAEFAAAPRLKTVVKSEAARQQPRRPAGKR